MNKEHVPQKFGACVAVAIIAAIGVWEYVPNWQPYYSVGAFILGFALAGFGFVIHCDLTHADELDTPADRG